MAKLVILGLITLVVVLVVRALLRLRQAYAEQIFDDEIGLLRTRVDYLHHAVYAPGATLSPNIVEGLKAALNEAKIKLNLLENPPEPEPAPVPGPNLMLDAVSAIEQAESIATAHGIALSEHVVPAK
jgi:hypothetical protein